MKNELKEVNLNYKDIEKQLSNYDFEVIKYRNDKIEYCNFPLFVRAFWCYIIYNQKIPSFKEFRDYYFKINKSKRSIKLLDDNDIKFMNGRLSRTYPSLARDIHFAKLLEDRIDFEIFYNMKMDTQMGIDVLVADKYGFHLFYDSKRSHNFRRRKEFAHDENEGIIEFDLPFNEKDGKEISNIYLYDDYHVIKVLELIAKEEMDGD